MKVAVTGSRTVEDYQTVVKAIQDSPFEPSKIIHGGARGVDSLADRYAAMEGIKTEVVRPNNPQLKSSYLDRNDTIVSMCDAVVSIWGEHPENESQLSNGTRDTIEKAVKMGKSVFIKSAIDQNDSQPHL